MSSYKGVTKFTVQEDEKVKAEYLNKPINTLAREMGRSDSGIKSALKRMGLVIPLEIVEQRILDSRIKKGNVPINKGKKQYEYMSADTIERTKATRFQKGIVPYNTKEQDGIITTRQDKRGVPYKYIRISKGKWQEYHRYLWEQANGKIPPKHCVIFIDGNTLNATLENLKLITMNENARRNQEAFLSLPPELQETKTLINKLNKKVEEHGKH